MDVPGASSAWKEEKAFYTRSELDKEIDPDIKHLWSAPVRDRRGNTLAAVNIDNIADDELPEDQRTGTLKAIEHLADLVSYYWEIPG